LALVPVDLGPATWLLLRISGGPAVIYELRALGAPGGEEARTIGVFEAGVLAYRSRAWDDAEARFRAALEGWEGDGPSAQYLENIAFKRLHPPGQGWDAVYEMKTKWRCLQG
jgi:hypothetical protein